MAVVVPATDAANYELYNGVTTLTNLIASSNNGKQVFEFTKLKSSKQLQLVLGLLGSGRILASNILANETYTAGAPGGDQN
jgi:hypothetical protein